jgi:chaperone required for assembly of F1-ATPase
VTGGWDLRRRFWSAVSVEPAPQGWTVLLDGRPMRTPAKAEFVAPTAAAAEACAAEWAAQGERFDPRTMPVTRALNTAIDRIAPQHPAVVAEIAGYGGSDLLCYRAPSPAELAARQAAAWDPWLVWTREKLGADLICAEGVMHVAQPPAALARLEATVAARSAFELAALHDLCALSGSLILGLAVETAALDPAEAWRLSRIDEEWQIEQWGEDAEAAEAAALKRADLESAARLAALLRQG